LIAIPDFSAGAMENWGLITYRENSLLFSESQTSVIAKQWIAVVVAHELAHQGPIKKTFLSVIYQFCSNFFLCL
jgi:hypothetical protein